MGGRVGNLFFFLTEDRFFFFQSLLDGKKSAEQLQCWETIRFPPLRRNSKEEFVPCWRCVGCLLPPWGQRGPFPSMGRATNSMWLLQR